MSSKTNDVIFYACCASGIVFSSLALTASVIEMQDNERVVFQKISNNQLHSRQVDQLIAELQYTQYVSLTKATLGATFLGFFSFMFVTY